MRRLLIATALFFVSVAYGDDYWVLGSFEIKSHGIAEAERLESATGLDVRLVRHQANYRVVVPMWKPESGNPGTQRQMIEQQGIEPWTWRDAVPGDEVSLVTTGHRYYAVVAAFRNRARADAASERLSNDGESGVSIMISDGPGDQIYRVVQGPHKSKDPAVKQRLTSAGYAGVWWLAEVSNGISGTGTEALPGSAEQASVDQAPAMARSAPASTKLAKSNPATGDSGASTAASSSSLPTQVTSQANRSQAAMTTNPPQAGESFRDYCLNRANRDERRIYCGDSSFNDLVKAEQRTIDRSTYLLEFCALRANAEERRKYCSD